MRHLANLLLVLAIIGRMSSVTHADENGSDIGIASETKEEAAPVVRREKRDLSIPDGLDKKVYRGRVVSVFEALKRRGVKASHDELKEQVVLENQNELIPILPDWRGRAFFQDKRLRDRDVELIGFRRRGIPYLSILAVYTFDDDGRRQYTDYWCDVCSIPMYELKPCDCCQQEIRLRFERQELPKEFRDKDQRVPELK